MMNRQNQWFKEHFKNVTSLTGEDGIIEYVIEKLPEKNEWCVEFGAWDGVYASNTYNLIKNKSWKGVLIEPNKFKYNELVINYNNSKNVFLINKFVGYQSPDSLDNILNGIDIPNNFDLLSIDIDGNDYHIWESIHIYEPKVVVIEFNPSIPNNIEFIQNRDIYINQGSSLLALINLGKKKGYELIAITDNNAFFIKQEHYDLFSNYDNSIDSIRPTSPFLSYIYQLYDGTLVLEGCKKFIWQQGVEIKQDKIQILPKIIRFFPPNAGLIRRLLRIIWLYLYKKNLI